MQPRGGQGGGNPGAAHLCSFCLPPRECLPGRPLSLAGCTCSVGFPRVLQVPCSAAALRALFLSSFSFLLFAKGSLQAPPLVQEKGVALVFCEHKFDHNTFPWLVPSSRGEVVFVALGSRFIPPFQGESHPEAGPPDSERVNYWTNRECLLTLPKLTSLTCRARLPRALTAGTKSVTPYHNWRTVFFLLGEGFGSWALCPFGLKR